ncbi:hypothetical protein SFC55_20485 [Niallia taxi]|uniref:DUF7379 domain-containing protein n=1 Tax=Niallia taxi TaxID=2499688 RepID=UPI003982493C
MDYVFYKNLYNDRGQISNLESNVIDLRTIIFNSQEGEKELPVTIQETLASMRRILDLNKLPFTLISEEMIKKFKYSQGWESMAFIIPKDVDYIYEFSINDSSSEGIDMSTDVKKQESDEDVNIVDYPKKIHNNDENVLEFFHLSRFKDKKTSNRYFLFMRNWGRTASSIFKKYKSRFYKLNSDILDDELSDYTYKQIPVSESDKPVAVIVHGFMSFTEGNFIALKKSLIASDEYSEVFGYSYPPNKVGIRDNGLDLLKTLNDTGLLYSNRNIDLYAHSEGGLVCRSMIARDLKYVSPSKINIRHLITAGTPHLGTPLAKIGVEIFTIPKLAIYISNTFIQSFFYGPSMQSITVLKKLLLHNYLRKTKNLGLKDMIPNSDFLIDLNKKCNDNNYNISGSIILASYHLEDYKSLHMPVSKLIIALNNVFENEKHDGVVPKKSSEFMFTESKPIVLVEESEGWHSEYYGNDSKAGNIVKKVLSLGKIPATR